jgi:hypothetical protein
MVWIQALEPRDESGVMYLELQVNEALTRCVHLARAWFAASPEPKLEMQGFRVDAVLLVREGNSDIKTGLYAERPSGLKLGAQPSDETLLCVAKNALWFSVRWARGTALETTRITDDFPLRVALIERAVGAEEQLTQVTLALELLILHEGAFDQPALEELLFNLDFALESQRGNASLAPERVDGVTEHFAFRVLDIRPVPLALNTR